MEYINKIEIQGTIGMIRTIEFPDEMVANMSVATENIYTNKQNDKIAETTWHSVVVWGSKTSVDLSKLERGTKVHIVGRIRNTRYTSADGQEKTFTEILANEFEIVE